MRIRPILNFSHIFFENGLQFQKLCLPLQLQTRKIGAIAQLVEQRTENPCVPGSIPGGTTCKTPKYLIIKCFGVFRFSHYKSHYLNRVSSSTFSFSVLI